MEHSLGLGHDSCTPGGGGGGGGVGDEGGGIRRVETLTICQYLTFLSLESATSEAVTASVESMEHSLGLGHDSCTCARFAKIRTENEQHQHKFQLCKIILWMFHYKHL